jgi:hypothetical protein
VTATDIAAAAQRFGQQDDISIISVSRTASRETALAQNLEPVADPEYVARASQHQWQI